MLFFKSSIIIILTIIPLIKLQNTTSGNFSTINNSTNKKKKIEEFTLPPINQIWDITVKMGEGFIIKIFSNPTTGYNWYIDNIDQIKESKILNCINLNDNNSTGKFIVDNPENLIMGQPNLNLLVIIMKVILNLIFLKKLFLLKKNLGKILIIELLKLEFFLKNKFFLFFSIFIFLNVIFIKSNGIFIFFNFY